MNRQSNSTRRTINEIIAFLNDLTVPDGLSKAQAWRFKKKYGSGAYVVKNDLLFFKDPKDGLEKQVIASEDRETTLNALFTNPATMGTSRDHMFKRVFKTYIGISRRQVQEFLLRQPSYQIHRRVRRNPVVKPIVAKHANSHW